MNPDAMIQVQLTNQQAAHPIDSDRLVRAARTVLAGEGLQRGSLSLAVVDDPTIHALNRQYLQHDYPTDVLSFLLDEAPDRWAGEVIVSADTAAARAGEFGWSPQDELTLYVVHGTLHLFGYDDADEASCGRMRAREQDYLRRLGIVPAATAPREAGGFSQNGCDRDTPC
jgi:probable rRNA maturation factor